MIGLEAMTCPVHGTKPQAIDTMQGEKYPGNKLSTSVTERE